MDTLSKLPVDSKIEETTGNRFVVSFETQTKNLDGEPMFACEINGIDREGALQRLLATLKANDIEYNEETRTLKWL